MHGSGLALGIDTIAHAAALEAGGRTLAVLASSIDQVYPERNRGLANQIMACGALISEFLTKSRPIQPIDRPGGSKIALLGSWAA